jgi:hypothetical protein
VAPSRLMLRKLRRRAEVKSVTRLQHGKSMISVSDNQLRIVAEAADLLPAEARGTFLRRVVAEVREGRSFKDSDIERAVRLALFDQPMKQASVSSPNQGGGKLRSDTPTDSQEPLASHPLAEFLQRITGFVRLRGFSRSFNFLTSVNSRSGKVCRSLRRHFESGERRVREREEHIALQREIVAHLEHLQDPITLQKARDLLRNMEHAQMLHVAERDQLRGLLGD